VSGFGGISGGVPARQHFPPPNTGAWTAFPKALPWHDLASQQNRRGGDLAQAFGCKRPCQGRMIADIATSKGG
jgi:hypothetical protein